MAEEDTYLGGRECKVMTVLICYLMLFKLLKRLFPPIYTLKMNSKNMLAMLVCEADVPLNAALALDVCRLAHSTKI